MTIYFLCLGSGIGDVLVCKPAFEWLCANGAEPVFFVARGPRQVGLSRLLQGAAGEVREDELPGIVKPEDRVINLRAHSWQTDHDWFSAEFKARYPGIKVSEILDDACREHGIHADNREIRALPFSIDERGSNKVVLVPNTTMKAKKLRPQFWMDLAHTLKVRGWDAIVLGSTAPNTVNATELQTLVEHGLTHHATQDLQEAINIISSARAVVSLDTGLMHIAVQQGINTVAIFGACEVYYRPAPNCFPIFTDRRVPAQENYKLYKFSSVYDTWGELPSTADDGDYIDFADCDKVLQLLGLG